MLVVSGVEPKKATTESEENEQSRCVRCGTVDVRLGNTTFSCFDTSAGLL
jgi:hypothetical protein